MTRSEFLITYAPPVRLTRWVNASIEQKRKRGEEIPEAITNWLNVWEKTLHDAESQLIEDLKTVESMEF